MAATPENKTLDMFVLPEQKLIANSSMDYRREISELVGQVLKVYATHESRSAVIMFQA